jgi:hypothetical protein
MADTQGTGSSSSGPNTQDSAEPAPHWSRNAGGIAALIALAAFIFGVGNFTDLKARVTGEYQRRQTAQRIHTSFVRSYIGFESFCGGLTQPSKVTLSWLNAVLKVRINFANAWAGRPDDGLTNAERADMAAARSNFRAASGFWSALATDFKAADISAYDTHLGEYYQAMADYLSVVYRYGVHDSCAVTWPTPPFWTPPS